MKNRLKLINIVMIVAFIVSLLLAIANEFLKERKEINVINAFLPKQLNNEETRKICEEAIKSVGATSMKDMGKIMGVLKSKHADTLDFSKVSLVIKELLK